MKSWVGFAFVAALGCWSCRPRDSAPQAVASGALDTVAGTLPDSAAAADARADSLAAAQRNQHLDSVTPIISALEDSLTAFPSHAHRADWLWRLGELWRTNLAGFACPSMAPPPVLGVKYAQYFFQDCCECARLYNYDHWHKLIDSFPNDPHAAEASYELTKAERGGECEGDVSCWIQRDFGPLNDFLRRFPNSVHAAEAVERANDAFASALTFRPDEHELFDLNDRDVVTLIARYDSTATNLPPPLRAKAYRVIGPLWSMFNANARAAELYRLSVTENAPAGDTIPLRRTWDSLVALLKAPRPPSPPPDPVMSYRDLEVGPIRLNESREVVRNRLGEPDSVLSVDNPRYPGRSTLVTWFYRTRHQVIVDLRSLGMALKVTTTDSMLSTPRGIRVGDPADSVTARYGAPNTKSGEEWVYPATDYPQAILRFTMRNGRVVEIFFGNTGDDP